MISYSWLLKRGSQKFFRLQSRFTRKLLLPFGRDLRPNRWIFVVGCYNSGTTLLAGILASHPLIGALPNEGIYFTDAMPYPEQFGWPRMWIRCLDKVRLTPDSLSLGKVRRIKKQWSLLYPNYTPNLLEKSVANTTRLNFLETHFAPAYFVSIVRNGYAVSEGIRRRVRPGQWKNPEFSDRYPLELCAQQWSASDEIITRDRSQLSHFKQVTYEALTADPQKVVEEITDFLGLPPLKAEVFGGSWGVQEKNEPIANMNSRSFERLSEKDLDIIEETAGDCLLKYGYERPSKATAK